MNLKKIISVILKLPIILLIIGSLGAGCYAAYFHIQNISWSTPIILGIIIILYIIGYFLGKNQSSKNDSLSKTPEQSQ